MQGAQRVRSQQGKAVAGSELKTDQHRVEIGFQRAERTLFVRTPSPDARKAIHQRRRHPVFRFSASRIDIY